MGLENCTDLNNNLNDDPGGIEGSPPNDPVGRGKEKMCDIELPV
jgi:hypothetical protein